MTQKDSTISRIIRFVKNKYFIATAIFLVIILFFSSNNIFFILGLSREVSNLHEEEKMLQEQITSDSIFFNGIKGNKEAIERYGREEYKLKKANEDLFVITSSPDEK